MAAEHDERLARLEQDNVQLRRAVYLMHQIADLARESLELEGVGYAVLTGVTAGVGLGLNRAMLFVADPNDRRSLMGAAAVGPADEVEADRVWRAIEAEDPDLHVLYEAGQRLRRARSPLDAAVCQARVDLTGDTPVALAFRNDALVVRRGSDDLGGLLHPATCVAAPLRTRSGRIGVLYADNRFTGHPLNEITETVFEMVAGHAGRALENARSYQAAVFASRTDSLTGLGHHGALMEALAGAVDRARLSKQPLSLVMIDIDDFKRINDTLGHLQGDRILAEIAHRIRRVVRNESVYRYGGEEFTALLEGIYLNGAAAVCDRICRVVHDEGFIPDQGPALLVTCSLGVACLRGNESGAELLARADAALLAAKRGGKNRVQRG